MIGWFVLGLGLLVGFVLMARWVADAEPATLWRGIKIVGFVLVAALVLFLALTGRLGWAFAALPALLPWFLRFRQIARTAKAFRRMGQGGTGATGRTSEVETRFVAMTLDHDSGEMDGTVREGPQAGQRLADLDDAALAELLDLCRREDPQSAQVLEAYVERMRPDSGSAGEGEEEKASGGGFAQSMDRDEALRILGLEDGATASDIKEAHRRLIAGLHPDHGGSGYLAAKINQAKDVLLKGRGRNAD